MDSQHGIARLAYEWLQVQGMERKHKESVHLPEGSSLLKLKMEAFSDR
jgi:hypothetical protein